MKHRKGLVTMLSDDSKAQDNAEWNRKFWARVSDTLKFQAAWEMVEIAWELQGKRRNELRLERTIGLLKPPPR